MKVEDLKNGLGRTVVTTWDQRLRIIDVCETYILVDAPDHRAYFTNGKLMPMPTKKIYFETTNQTWNTRSLVKFDDGYVFKMQKFERENITVAERNVEKNILPSIEESKKLKPPVYRRDKEALRRNALFKATKGRRGENS